MPIPTKPKRWYKSPAIIIPIIVALIGAMTAITVPIIERNLQEHEETTPLTVTITSPEKNTVITSDSFHLLGQMNKPLDKDNFLYVVVQDNSYLWWPTRILPSYSNESKMHEFDCTVWIHKSSLDMTVFVIKVISVDSIVHSKFQEWQSDCIAKTDWPGISSSEPSKWGVLQTFTEVTVIY